MRPSEVYRVLTMVAYCSKVFELLLTSSEKLMKTEILKPVMNIQCPCHYLYVHILVHRRAVPGRQNLAPVSHRAEHVNFAMSMGGQCSVMSVVEACCNSANSSLMQHDNTWHSVANIRMMSADSLLTMVIDFLSNRMGTCTSHATSQHL